MLRLAVLSVLVAGSLASFSTYLCSAEDRKEVAAFWREVWGAQYTERRVVIAKKVFERLFESDPSSKALFARVNVDNLDSPEFKAHCVRVINGLDVCINLLDDPATLIKHLLHLNDQHKKRDGVKALHFQEIGKAFLEVLPEAGSCFNPRAWKDCFDRISAGITDGLP